MSRMATLLQLAGLVVATAGCWILAPWLGLLIAGLALTGIGLLIEFDERKAG